RAAKLGLAGFERFVSVLRLTPAISADTELSRALMEQAKIAARLHSPNVVRTLGIGRVEAAYYIASEFIEGKSLEGILERCGRDEFPLSVDHALLICSKVCSALEYARGHRAENGERLVHGLVNPGNVVVSYEGEVRLRGFGHWAARLESGMLRQRDRGYLAPEQAAGGGVDTRSDCYAVGAMLFEALVGETFSRPGAGGDVAARLREYEEDAALAPELVAILTRSLAEDPGARYPELYEMRRAVDTLLFSGEFTPTTFNLAFFMHSLFRDDIEEEATRLQKERQESYAEFLREPGPGPTGARPDDEPSVPPLAASPPRPATGLTQGETRPRPESPRPEPPRSAPAARPLASTLSPAPAPREAAFRFTFDRPAPPRRRWPLVLLVALGIAALVAGVYLGRRVFESRRSGSQGTIPSTLGPGATTASAASSPT
ncbi:MAG TPA: serine/threonine-protein kinase, partial [Vicinamibacteria bacterium]